MTEPPCFGWGMSTCQFFFWVQNFYSLFQFFFFWVQNFYALFILIWDAFIFILFYFFSLFVFILFEHPWHAIDVFVRLRECRLKSPIILLPKKVFYFTLVYLEISQASFLFFSFVCVCVYIIWASLACHWCVCEIAWMSFKKSYNFTAQKSILFYLGLFGNISGVIFKMCCGLLEECKTLK